MGGLESSREKNHFRLPLKKISNCNNGVPRTKVHPRKGKEKEGVHHRVMVKKPRGTSGPGKGKKEEVAQGTNKGKEKPLCFMGQGKKDGQPVNNRGTWGGPKPTVGKKKKHA